MRTDEEIVAHVKKVSEGFDLFSTVADLIVYLPYKHAKQFLKEGVTEEDWEESYRPLTREAVIKEIINYMDFAIGKAEGHRGISADRSIEHYKRWVWLLGDDDLLEFLEDSDNYENYGAPMLKKICETYKIPFPLKGA